MLPSIVQLGKAIENIFVMEDWHNLGTDYDKTLMAWYINFDKNWDKIKSNYSERFYRMWKYFLLSSAGSFRSRRRNQVWQIVLSKKGISGGYNSVR
jgi:cyclopropane-fatty-acyl-phospholipid synthase